MDSFDHTFQGRVPRGGSQRRILHSSMNKSKVVNDEFQDGFYYIMENGTFQKKQQSYHADKTIRYNHQPKEGPAPGQYEAKTTTAAVQKKIKGQSNLGRLAKYGS